MPLDALDTRILALREQASNLTLQYQATVQRITNDDTLTLVGKAERLNGLWEAVTEQVAQLKDKEARLVADATLALEQRINGTVTGSGADIISFRDARDRASRVERNEAANAMQEALDARDEELARAYLRHAMNNRWTDVVQQYADAHPGIEGTITDLNDLISRTMNGQFRFNQAMAYSVPR